MKPSALSLRAAARAAATAPAIITRDGELSFAEVWDRVGPVIHELRETDPRSPLVVVASVRLETLLAIYGAVEIGRPVVLIHPRLTPSERAPLIEMVGARTVFDEQWRPTPSAASVDVSDVEPPDDESALAVVFSSGSSGSPKGVELSRRAFAASAAASAKNLGWRSDDRWLLCMPIAHVGGLSIVLRCLAARVPVVLAPWGGGVDPLLADIEQLGVTLLSLVPTMLARILEEKPGYRFPARVRAVLLGGDASSAALLRAAAERGVPVLTTYGMTETCSQIATLSPGESATSESGSGRPLEGTEVRIRDGEIHVRGPTLFTRYLPVGTPAPFLEGGWFPTGDLGHLDELGRLHVTGRRSDMIITGGENVDPREVERALAACEGVRAACVFGVPDERWGQIVAAALVLEPSVTLAAAIAEARLRLARHKWPRLAGRCAELALNATGKVDRRRTAASVELVDVTRMLASAPSS